MDFADELPPSCPPPDAMEITDVRFVYRLVTSSPPATLDFCNHRVLYPAKIFQDECEARSLSVFDQIQSARELAKLPNHKGKFICRIQLRPGAGKVKRTGRRSGHYSWWRYAEFDVAGNATLEAGAA